MLDAIVEATGPFLVPVVIFVAGVIGYLVLLILSRRGILGEE